MKFNKVLIVLLPVILLTATRSTAGPGTATSDGSDGVVLPAQTEQATEAGAEVRYLVPHMRSAVFATAGGGRVTTVISATNGGTTPCNVTVEHYFAFNSDMIPECTLTVALAPLLAPGSDTANTCTRPIPGDRWTLCTASCNPALAFVQGKSLVRVPESCAGAVAIEARMYHSDPADDVRTINALRVFRLRD